MVISGIPAKILGMASAIALFVINCYIAYRWLYGELKSHIMFYGIEECRQNYPYFKKGIFSKIFMTGLNGCAGRMFVILNYVHIVVLILCGASLIVDVCLMVETSSRIFKAMIGTSTGMFFINAAIKMFWIKPKFTINANNKKNNVANESTTNE